MASKFRFRTEVQHPDRLMKNRIKIKVALKRAQFGRALLVITLAVQRHGMKYKNLIGTEVRKRRAQLGWSQETLAIKLQLAGLDYDRSQVSKIECRLVHVSDYEQLYIAEALKVTVADLFPAKPQNQPTHLFVPNAMKRKRRRRRKNGPEDSSNPG